ncbi:MAG: hypothetical protein WCK93_03755 [Nitrosomonadales bacterium]|jgi:uncharacterized membrane protein YadS
MENSKCKVLILPFIIAALLWLIGGFFLSKELGMICVIFGIAIAGWAAGNIMNSDCELSEDN